MNKIGKGKMAAIIITVILVAAIIGVSSWLIAVTAKSGKYNLIKVKKSGVPAAVSGDPEEYDVEVNGINMHYAVMGKGSPLILIHGNGGSHEELMGLMRYFANDYRVYAPDSRNQGKSGTSDELSYKLMASDYKAFIDALNIEKPLVIGHSDGGIIAIQMSMDYPTLLKGFVAFGANSRPAGMRSYFTTWAKRKYKKTNDPLYRIMIEEPDFSEEQLGKITTPAYIVAGEFDIVKLEDTVYLHENIKSSKIAILKWADHSTCRTVPEIGYKVANEFFKTL